MPSGGIRHFTDADDYAAAHRQADVRLTITGRGNFEGSITRIELHHLWLQRQSANLPRIAQVVDRGDRAVFILPAQHGRIPNWVGHDVRPSDIYRSGVGATYLQQTPGPSIIGAMSLPLSAMDQIKGLIGTGEITLSNNGRVHRPQTDAMQRLRRLHAAAGRLAATAPEVIANPEAARGLEQGLIGALAGCLTQGESPQERSACRHHERIMRRFFNMVEDYSERAIYLPEICSAIGVAERTLRLCCNEQLGIGPKQFLTLRRMNLARRDLKRGRTGTTTVTQVAAQYGFWNFGRFSGEYKALFGELPSATLYA